MNKQIVALVLGAALIAHAKGEPLATPAPMAARAGNALLLALAKAGQRTVAVGERGIALYAEPGSAQWRQARVPVSVNLTAVHFADQRRGWAVGHDGVVLATDDGGASWRKQLDGHALNAMLLEQARQAQAQATGDAMQGAANALADVEAGMQFGPSRPLLAVWFRNASEGYAVGAFGLALRTRDGGVHWESIAVPQANPDGLHLNSIGPGHDGALLIAGEGGKVYRVHDGGARWERLDTGYQGQLYGVLASDPHTLLAFGFGGNLRRSVDAGKTWQALPQLTRASLVSAGRAGASLLLFAKDGGVLRSTDNGASFTVAAPGRGLQLSSVLVGSAALGAGVGGLHRVPLAAGASQ